MIILDYTTSNSRWGKSGIHFSDLLEYAKTLGFLSNIRHYKGKGLFSHAISMHIEGNYKDGAWAKECRIHYYGDKEYLRINLIALDRCSSAGVGNIVCRINSNRYINHLIDTYRFFCTNILEENYVKDVYPPEDEKVLDMFIHQLRSCTHSDSEINDAIRQFHMGFDL